MTFDGCRDCENAGDTDSKCSGTEDQSRSVLINRLLACLPSGFLKLRRRNRSEIRDRGRKIMLYCASPSTSVARVVLGTSLDLQPTVDFLQRASRRTASAAQQLPSEYAFLHETVARNFSISIKTWVSFEMKM